MLPVISPQQMRDAEHRAFDKGVPSILLMENAARKLTEALVGMLGAAMDKRVAFFCGQGNNGGDGLAVARLFHQLGGKPYICLLGTPSTPDAQSNLSYAQALGISFVDDPSQLHDLDGAVDALFGIGLNRAPQGRGAELIEAINALQVPVLAVDVPSGFDALSGDAHQPCVQASLTVSMQYPKLGHYLTQKPDLLGELRVCDIGLPDGCLVDSGLSTLEPQDLASLLPRRSQAAHKGSNGRVLILAGSRGMAGAAAMAALGCLRAGAGLVTIACEGASLPVLQALVPGATCRDIDGLFEPLPPHDVLLAGCGLAETEASWDCLTRLYDRDKPTVLDAGALNMLAQRGMTLGANTLITPHMGEAARMLGMSVADVLQDKLKALSALQQCFGCAVLMKSHVSFISDGYHTALNTVGSAALAKGGSGDALAGIVAGLMAQGQTPFEAACVGSLWLGKAGRLAQLRHGLHSALTMDVLDLLHEAVNG